MSEIKIDFHPVGGEDGLVHVYLHYQRYTLCGQDKDGLAEGKPDCKTCRAELYRMLIDEVDGAWDFHQPHRPLSDR